VASQIDIICNLIHRLLGLALVIALIGIANTLALPVHERRRELGLLLAVGMTRPQVPSAIPVGVGNDRPHGDVPRFRPGRRRLLRDRRTPIKGDRPIPLVVPPVQLNRGSWS
jgi:hypothetical protein